MQNSALQYPSSSQNKCLVFRYFSLFLFSSWLVLSSSAFAFGGGGDNRLFDKEWMRGVDAFALHFNGKGELDIKFGCDDKNATPDRRGVCSCNKGYKLENDLCVIDACYQKGSECQACSSENGKATYTNLDTTAACGENGNYRCDGNGVCADPCKDADTPECHECYVEQGVAKFRPISDTTCGTDDNYICQSGTCTNPCDLITNKNPCKDYTPQGGQCVESNKADTTVCPDGNRSDNYICQSGTCTDPCTIGEHANFTPTLCFPAHHAENGQCVPDYAAKGTKNCDSEHSDYVCNGSGVCTCPEGQFRHDDGSCTSCSLNSNMLTTAEECSVCDNTSTPRMMWKYNGKNYCVLATCPEGQFHLDDGSCYPCSSTSSYKTTAEACAECDNTSTPRMMWATNGKCVLATCPGGHFRLNSGVCSECSGLVTTNFIISTDTTTQDECSKCQDTEYPRYYLSALHLCLPCFSSSAAYYLGDSSESEAFCQAQCGNLRIVIKDYQSNKRYCAPKDCMDDQFRSFEGTCYDCSYLGAPLTPPEFCQACENSQTPRISTGKGGVCKLETCPQNYLRNKRGGCTSCDVKSALTDYDVNAEACAACDNTANPRFMGTDDACYICTTSDSVTTTEEACNKCTNRTWTETTPASGDTPAQGTCALGG